MPTDVALVCKNLSDCHVRVYTDNTTYCLYINKFGGKRLELDCLANDICLWCLDNQIHLSVPHVPEASNSEADEMSGSFNDDMEWSLEDLQFAKYRVKKVREKSRECHNHKPQLFPDTKRKRKPTNPNKYKSNKRMKSTKISSLFPKRGNRNAKRTEKHKNKMAQGKTYNKIRLAE